MKKTIFLFIALLGMLSLRAQINFREGSFADILAAAKAENKLVFIDCYTVWCGPCKLLASNVFSQTEAGDYFNPRFVSMKLDMEKGEGLALKKRYDVNAYPTLLVLDTLGEVLCRPVASFDLNGLIASIEEGMKHNAMSEAEYRYRSGDRDARFILSYLELLDRANMSVACDSVAGAFLKDKTETVFTDENVYRIFRSYASPADAVFRQVYARKAEYIAKYGEQAGEQLDLTWEAYGRGFIHREAKKVVGYDAEGLDTYCQVMKEYGVPDAEGIRGKYLLEGAIATKDWAKLLEAIRAYAAFSRMEEGTLNYACNTLYFGQKGKGWNSAMRKRFAVLLKERVKALKGIKDTSGRTMSVNGKKIPIMEYYCQSYEEMLEKVR